MPLTQSAVPLHCATPHLVSKFGMQSATALPNLDLVAANMQTQLWQKWQRQRRALQPNTFTTAQLAVELHCDTSELAKYSMNLLHC